MSTEDALGILEQQLLQRGFELGRQIQARAVLRAILAWRNLVLETSDEARIEACCDVEALERWLEQALTATSVANALS